MTRDEAQLEERRLEHLRQMSTYAAEDARMVYLRVTACLSVGVLFFTQLPLDRLVALSLLYRLFLLGGLVALGGAALLFFLYTTRAHHARPEIATRILNGSRRDAAQWWNAKGPWKSRKWAFIGGDVLSGVGAILLGLVLARLLKVI